MPQGGESRDVVAGVVQLSNLLTRKLSPLFKKANVTPQQFAVLVALANNGGPSTLAAVARTMLVSKQNMTGIAQRLEQAGYIDRNDDPGDLRSSRVVLTRRGRSLVEKLRPAYEDSLRRMAGIDEHELEAFARTLQRLIDGLQG